MKKVIVSASFTALFLLSACFQKSLNPYYSEDTLIQIPELEGTWIDNHNYRITIKKDDKFHYRMIAEEAEGSSKAELSVHVFKLFETIFMDTYMEDIEPEPTNNYYAFNMLPSHNVFKVDILEDEWVLKPLLSKWTDSVISNRILYIEAVKTNEGERILTGSTEELQNLLACSLQDKDAYEDEDPIIWRKTE
jgi:hypothetical protein